VTGATFTAIIATKGRPVPLRDTLASLAECDPPPEDTIVVDGDPDRSAEGVAREAGVRYLATAPGSSRQRNVGIAAADGDVLVFCDDDIALDRSVFEALGEAYEDDSVVGATVHLVERTERSVGGMRSPLRRLLFRGEEGRFTRFGYPRYLTRLDEPRDVEIMPGCFMSARRRLAAELLFDERLPGYGLGEDEDFAYRLSRRGRIRYLPRATIVHEKFGWSSFDPREFSRMVVRHRAYLLQKNFAPGAIAWTQFALFVALLMAHRFVNRDWAGARGLAEGAVDLWRRPL